MCKPKLYYDDISPKVRSVLMLIKKLDLDIEFCFVNTLKCEHMEQDYRELNPGNSVPTFVDKDLVLFNSPAIQIYLACKYDAGSTLYTSNSVEQINILNMLFFDLSVLYRNHTSSITERLRQDDAEEVNSFYQERILDCYKMLEKILTKQNYMALNVMTIADYAVFGTITSLNIIYPVQKYATNLPKLNRWYQQMTSLPEFECIKAGIARERCAVQNFAKRTQLDFVISQDFVPLDEGEDEDDGLGQETVVKKIMCGILSYETDCTDNLKSRRKTVQKPDSRAVNQLKHIASCSCNKSLDRNFNKNQSRNNCTINYNLDKSQQNSAVKQHSNLSKGSSSLLKRQLCSGFERCQNSAITNNNFPKTFGQVRTSQNICSKSTNTLRRFQHGKDESVARKSLNIFQTQARASSFISQSAKLGERVRKSSTLPKVVPKTIARQSEALSHLKEPRATLKSSGVSEPKRPTMTRKNMASKSVYQTTEAGDIVPARNTKVGDGGSPKQKQSMEVLALANVGRLHTSGDSACKGSSGQLKVEPADRQCCCCRPPRYIRKDSDKVSSKVQRVPTNKSEITKFKHNCLLENSQNKNKREQSGLSRSCNRDISHQSQQFYCCPCCRSEQDNSHCRDIDDGRVCDSSQNACTTTKSMGARILPNLRKCGGQVLHKFENNLSNLSLDSNDNSIDRGKNAVGQKTDFKDMCMCTQCMQEMHCGFMDTCSPQYQASPAKGTGHANECNTNGKTCIGVDEDNKTKTMLLKFLRSLHNHVNMFINAETRDIGLKRSDKYSKFSDPCNFKRLKKEIFLQKLKLEIQEHLLHTMNFLMMKSEVEFNYSHSETPAIIKPGVIGAKTGNLKETSISKELENPSSSNTKNTQCKIFKLSRIVPSMKTTCLTATTGTVTKDAKTVKKKRKLKVKAAAKQKKRAIAGPKCLCINSTVSMVKLLRVVSNLLLKVKRSRNNIQQHKHENLVKRLDLKTLSKQTNTTGTKDYKIIVRPKQKNSEYLAIDANAQHFGPLANVLKYRNVKHFASIANKEINNKMLDIVNQIGARSQSKTSCQELVPNSNKLMDDTMSTLTPKCNTMDNIVVLYVNDKK